jgi:hypothetical protein
VNLGESEASGEEAGKAKVVGTQGQHDLRQTVMAVQVGRIGSLPCSQLNMTIYNAESSGQKIEERERERGKVGEK